MATKKTFNHKLGDPVTLMMSQEEGVVRSRANSLDHNPQYLVRYVAADGRQIEGWVDESALEAA